MDTNLTHLLGADTSRALEIAPRVWWVGHVLGDDAFQCHVYLLEQGDQSVLFDPGSRLTFPGTLQKIEEIIPFRKIRYFVCHHQDPDIAAALPLIDELIERPDALVVTHWRTQSLLKHYGLNLPFWLVDQREWRLKLEDRELRFVFTPYAHFPGAIATFDPASGVLFSSDLFGGFTQDPSLVAQDESAFESMRPFHEHYMPSRDILNYAMTQISRHPVKIIAPQHGSIIPERLVPFMIEKLRHLDCGIYLFARDDTDILRLSRFNQMLREITRTMLLYRDFRDIANQLLRVVQSNLPADRIDYYARLDDGDVLTLSQETRFSGVLGEAPAELLATLGRTREQWAEFYRTEPQAAAATLHANSFCSRGDGNGGMILTLPLFSPTQQRLEAAAVIHLEHPIPIDTEVEQVIQQLALPLQVALERELIYRTIEEERRKAYQRSIRDPLTGLFNRVYLQDAMARHCSIHDRDETMPVAAVMIDIDHFKRINDSHGHEAGDEVLRQIAGVLRDNVRGSDVAVRYGGDELILFLVGSSALGAADYGERIRRVVERHEFALPEGLRLRVTASIGVSVRARYEPMESVIRRADEALYQAKGLGRNRVELTSAQR